MHPSIHAGTNSDKLALIFHPSGSSVTYGKLDANSNRIANLLRSLGLVAGDVIALCVENTPAFFEIVWGAQRAGLYYVCLSTKLITDEVDYILKDSGARAFFVAAPLVDLHRLVESNNDLKFYTTAANDFGLPTLLDVYATMPPTRISDEQAGSDMLYSSGTTGRPKGIKPGRLVGAPIDTLDPVAALAARLYGATSETIYLCPAPLYHAAPLRWCMAMMRLGSTVVVLERFDAQDALYAIERYGVTVAQFVPTHFVRMLKLPEQARRSFSTVSLKAVIHAAAPCPVAVKEAMLEWWGPIIHEYYSGSEGIGGTFIGPTEWLAHKGSVGKPLTTKVHICDEHGNEVAPRTEGTIYFSGGPQFHYHNDPQKTADSRHSNGWMTLGDVGWVDEEGYLYLTDRKSFMIISGGVNIYPQEIENCLVAHPKVADVAVIGTPDEEMGEKVVAVIQPINWEDAGEGLADELRKFARAALSPVKVPRQFDFMAELPRHDTGKLYKRLLRDAYKNPPTGS